MAKKVVVIGSGFAGLSAACCLAKEGFEVTVLEKNDTAGGRARQFRAAGFTFDMGPSWYWMPDVFDDFFAHFGKKVSDYYILKRLDPSYAVWFGPHDRMDVPADMQALESLFEHHEAGSAAKLSKFIVELANGPVSDQAYAKLTDAGVIVVPDILANAGGVIVSYLEWFQNINGAKWTENQVNEKLEEYLTKATDNIFFTSKRLNITLKDAAFVVAIERLIK